MQVSHSPPLSSEDGTSMVEVMVGLAMGMVVLAGLSMLLITTTRGNARVSARAEASDNARVAMTRIIEELHSACVEPAKSPVFTGSTEDILVFNHGPYGGNTSPSAPVTKTELIYSSSDNTLSQSDNGGTPRILLSNVSAVAEEGVFEYKNPTVGEDRFETPLSAEDAAHTILVNVAFKASPKSEPVADASAGTEIQNSATLRLTPPTYEEGKVAKPCE
jgi:hypothetical protein